MIQNITLTDYPELLEALNAFRQCFIKKIVPVMEINLSATFLKSIAGRTDWTPAEAVRIYNIIKPFSIQIKQVGFDFKTVPPIALEQQKKYIENGSARTISYNGEEFHIKFPYHGNDHLITAVKTIPGRHWNGIDKRWEIPVTEASQVKQFALGHNFHIGESASRMISGIEDNLSASYNAEPVDLHLPVKGTFLPFQTGGIAYMIKNERVINADQMGLGKTISAIGALVGTDAFPALIICPKSLRYNWEDEFRKWTNLKVIILNRNNRKRLREILAYKMADVVITNFDGVYTHFLEEKTVVEIQKGKRAGTSYIKYKMNDIVRLFKGCAIDEIHECRNRKTRRFKTIKATVSHMKYCYGLTGTPIVTGPGDLASIFEIIGRIDDFGGRHKFLRKYAGLRKGQIDGTGQPQNLKELNLKMRSTCFVRREKYLVLKDMPEKFRHIIRVDLDNQKEYDHAFFSLQSWMAEKNYTSEQIDRALRAELLVRIGVLKQIAGRGKLAAFTEYAKEVFANGEKLIVAVWFRKTVEYIKKHFTQAVTIYGGDSDEQIEANKKLFMTDPKCNIIIITYKKGGIGHNLQAATRVAFLEQGWTAKDPDQMEDRAHRIGVVHNVNCDYFLGNGTIDEDIYKIIEGRRDLEKEATGGTQVIETTTFGDLQKALVNKLITSAS